MGGIIQGDINGLRGWAVISVIFYHFSIPGFSGGFVGVDVFFVISGFLMTQIIVSSLEREKNGGNPFSLVDFYLARGRRIIPALAVMTATTLALGWFCLANNDYKNLGAEAFFSLTFFSNYKYWLNPESTGGYFSIKDIRWLLHTWSLSVEWQFYLILPLALSVIWRVWPGRRVVASCLALAGVASFCSQRCRHAV
ncbi:MAG: acyltransferase [Hyphomicrobiaceae bacterium]